MNFYQRHIGDYLKDTAHLSLLEHGIYTRLLDVYYTRESGIPDDQAARLIGARGSEIKALKTVLNEYFTLIDGLWVQSRCDREIESYRDKSNKARRSASARWDKEQTHNERNANASTEEMRTHSECNAPNNHDPVTSNQYPEEQKREVDKPPPRPKFCKPTIPELRAYCESIGASINPVTFFNHYETVGWKVGKNPMRDWKAAVRGWNSRDAK